VWRDFSPLNALLDEKWSAAIILLRLGHYSFGIAEDERLVAHKSGGRYVKNRQRQGGQSTNRFQRNREKWIQELFDEVADVARSRVSEYGKRIDWLALGGDRTVLSQFMKRLTLPDGLTDRVAPWRVPVEQPGLDELRQAVVSAWSWRVWERPDV
jgi:peptide subunit release factor 1 (eRF1)